MTRGTVEIELDGIKFAGSYELLGGEHPLVTVYAYGGEASSHLREFTVTQRAQQLLLELAPHRAPQAPDQ